MNTEVSTKRPVNLDLTKFKFPPMAMLSISHRISGVILFLFIPYFICILHQSVSSQNAFNLLQLAMHGFWMRLAMWIGLSATLFHLLSGIRHMIMDLGFGEGVQAGKWSAYTVFVLGFIVIILLGVWVW